MGTCSLTELSVNVDSNAYFQGCGEIKVMRDMKKLPRLHTLQTQIYQSRREKRQFADHKFSRVGSRQGHQHLAVGPGAPKKREACVHCRHHTCKPGCDQRAQRQGAELEEPQLVPGKGKPCGDLGAMFTGSDLLGGRALGFRAPWLL